MCRITDTAFPRLAVVGPFTGPRAAWGELLTAALRGARGARVDLETFDDQGDPDVALACAGQIVASGAHAAVIGHFNSGGAAAALPLYREAGVAALLPLATRPGLLAYGSGYALRTCPTDAAQAELIMRETLRRGHSRLTVLDDGSAYGRELGGYFTPRPELRVTRGGPRHRPERSAPVVVCGVLAGVAAIVSRLGVERHEGPVVVTDDCAVPAFARLTPTRPRDTRVCQVSGTPLGRVVEAVEATVAALHDAPALSGPSLISDIRARLPHAVDATGELIVTAEDPGWMLIGPDELHDRSDRRAGVGAN